MSHVIAPEVTIDSTPLLMEFCSDDFDINTVKLSLNEVEAAAKAVKEACSVSAKAINNAKSNILRAYMADPACHRWLKKEFQKRVDCDNNLLTRIANSVGFKFYTNDKLVIEALENKGEQTSNEFLAQATGVPEKMVERIKTKIQKKREDEILTEQIAIEVALASDKEERPSTHMESLAVKMNDDAGNSKAIDLEPIAEINPETGEPEVAIARALPSMNHVKVITTKVKAKIEADFLKEIKYLKSQLSEKDAEITRLKAMLEE
jgi:hypothetical protein